MEAQADPVFRNVLNSAFLNTPDGMPTVWVGRAQGHRDMGRVYGPDLMLSVFEQGVERGYRHFFFGGNVGVAADLECALRSRFPGALVVGTYTPPFRPLSEEEGIELVEQVRRAAPDIVWVGLSTPKQERFMSEYLGILETTLMVGVGAAFDIHTGRIKEPSEWLKHSGLQWVHRLAQEPRRLWRRYLYNTPRFSCQIALQFLGLRTFRIAPDMNRRRPLSRARTATGLPPDSRLHLDSGVLERTLGHALRSSTRSKMTAPGSPATPPRRAAAASWSGATSTALREGAGRPPRRAACRRPPL